MNKLFEMFSRPKSSEEWSDDKLSQIEIEVQEATQELEKLGGPETLLREIETLKYAHKFEHMSPINKNIIIDLFNIAKTMGMAPIDFLKHLPERIKLNRKKRKFEDTGLM